MILLQINSRWKTNLWHLLEKNRFPKYKPKMYIQGLRVYSGWGVEYIDTLFGHKRMKSRMNAGIFKYLCRTTTTDHFSN